MRAADIWRLTVGGGSHDEDQRTCSMKYAQAAMRSCKRRSEQLYLLAVDLYNGTAEHWHDEALMNIYYKNNNVIFGVISTLLLKLWISMWGRSVEILWVVMSDDANIGIPSRSNCYMQRRTRVSGAMGDG